MPTLSDDAKRYIEGGFRHGTELDVIWEVMTGPPFAQYPHEEHVKAVLKYVLEESRWGRGGDDE